MLIGITGTDGAGKGEVVNYLVEKYGFVHFSSRELIVSEIEKRGLSVSRESMRIVGNSMREEKGAGVIVAVTLEKISTKNIERAIVESIRNLKEVEVLKGARGILLAVDAPLQLRFSRIKGRGSGTDQVTLEEFIEQERKETNDKNPNGMQKAKVMAVADVTFVNDGTIEEFHLQIENWLKTLNLKSL